MATAPNRESCRAGSIRFCVVASLPAMLKTFSLSLLFMLAIGLMIAFYASIPT